MSNKSPNLSLLRNPVVNRLRERPDSHVTRGLIFLLKSWRCITTRPVNRVVHLDRVLCGGENGLSARQYAFHTGNFLRPSTPFARSPHVQFLEQYKQVGDEIFRPEVFRRTAYCANAVECMSVVGQYFTCTREDQLEQVARGFAARFRNDKPPTGTNGGSPIETSGPRASAFFSRPSALARVQPIKLSDCYAVVDGNHRLAIAYARGERTHTVRVEPPAVLTPLQQLLLDYAWCATRGERELYQPVESPELGEHWILVRRCADRLGMMKKFLEEHDLMPPRCQSYLDIASSYGWFVREFSRSGFDAHGVEIDWAAVEIGQHVYGLKPCQITRSEVVRFLKGDAGSYDVVSCFSLLHHFAMGNGSISAEEMLGLIERATKTVLFLDVGQCHEAWFRDSLPGWDADHVERWLRDNSGFTKIYRLGTDSDNVPPYDDNYGRTLFACMR